MRLDTAKSFIGCENDTEVIERTFEMKCGGNQLGLRTFIVRALSFSAVAALTLNPALSPVVAANPMPALWRLPPADPRHGFCRSASANP